jgi:hypothetical protein
MKSCIDFEITNEGSQHVDSISDDYDFINWKYDA